MTTDRHGRYVISSDMHLTEAEADELRRRFVDALASDRPVVLGDNGHIWDTVEGRYICHPDAESHRAER